MCSTWGHYLEPQTIITSAFFRHLTLSHKEVLPSTEHLTGPFLETVSARALNLALPIPARSNFNFLREKLFRIESLRSRDPPKEATYDDATSAQCLKPRSARKSAAQT